jgi:hypothetical protein
MTRKLTTLWIACAALALAGVGCAAEAHAEPTGSALQAAGAAGGAAVDRDDDVDERADEASDRDNDVDEEADESNDRDDGPNDDVELTVDELPAAVRTVVDAEVGSGTITDIERDQERSGVTFEVDYTNASGERWELDVAEDGKVLRSKRD